MNKHQQALIAAKAELPRLQFICNALDAVARKHPHLRSAALAVQAHVQNDLRADNPWPGTTVILDDTVLRLNGTHPGGKMMALCREAWIDKMISDTFKEIDIHA